MLKDVDDENSTTQDCNHGVITLDLSDFPARYRDVCPLGCGSKGLIFSAVDQRSLRRLAVKKLTVKQEDKITFLRQVLREIRILHRLEHQNIIKIYHVLVSTGGTPGSFKPPTTASNDVQSIESLYVGMELMDTDLRNVIKKTSLSPEYIMLFMYQILRGVKYMHSANVMHRDMNPSNIFINMDTLMVKIGDFGVSRLHDSEYDHNYHLSMPLTTKYYQAPELLLHPHHYTKAVDVWALGCIFVEMIKGCPAFMGEHVLEQMGLILETVPVTAKDWQSVVEAGCQDINCCAPPIEYPKQDNNGSPVKSLEKVLPDASQTALNLLKQLLAFDPQIRIPAEDALNHPYFISYSNPSDEPCCHRPFRIEDELDEYSSVDLEAMLQNESYSVTSSFSKSTDTNVSQAPVADDWNMLRVNSRISLPTNGSYRHLLSLAENTQTDVLSESEVRTMACDFDYGVQIHECSFNKDRMSMDFRPISSDAGCFDPYKWDHSGSRGPISSSQAKKEATTSHHAKTNKTADPNHRGVSRSDTGYNSSYCSSITNRVSNAHSSTLWSLSSPDVSSDHEHHPSCATPDSISSPPFNTATDPESSANSPVLQEDGHTEPAPTRRHNDSILHQSSSRRHHHHHSHHHHHHSHHHHHHKHKNRQNHNSVHVNNVSALHFKNGSGDSSNEHTDNGATNADSTSHNSDSCSRVKRGKTRSNRDRDHIEKLDRTTVTPKNVTMIVTGPDNEVVETPDNSIICIKKDSEKITHTSPAEELPDANPTDSDKFDKKESIHEHFAYSHTNLQEHASSAFTKYVSTSSNENIVTVTEANSCKAATTVTHSSSKLVEDSRNKRASRINRITSDGKGPTSCISHGSITLEDDSVKTKILECSSFSGAEGLATIKNMWKNDLSISSWQADEAPQRPRTWSEGCRVRPYGERSMVKLADLPPEKSAVSSNMLTCTLVQKLRSHFSQFFSEGCCLSGPDLPAPLPIQPNENLFFGRMRHFSDDRRYVCSPKVYSTVKNAPEGSDRLDVSHNNPPTTCSSAENIYPGAIKMPYARVECPF